MHLRCMLHSGDMSARERIFLGILALLVLGGGYGVYRYLTLSQVHTALVAAKAEADAHAADLTSELTHEKEERARVADALTAEQAKNGTFEKQISDISGTVGTLEKLAKTDPELLAKYSKVYFLNENYIPSALSPIDEKYLSDSSRALSIHAEVVRDLEEMIDDAADDGVTLKIASAYRSFGTQAALKSSYTVSYGAGANRFSADQGYSEHQLGTTVDITTPEIGGSLTGFEKTAAYEWLTKHAYRYGFILSYPAANTYYQFEPWHWRFVGHDLADTLHDDKKNFYDLDQRTIDTYLVSLFD